MVAQHGERSVRVRGLEVETDSGTLQILHGVDFEMARGEVVGLAGETGSGKTTFGLSLLGFQRAGLRIAGGEVVVRGEDLASAGGKALRRLRGDRISYVPQDPSASLNPALRVKDAFGEVMSAHGLTRREEQLPRVASLLQTVALPQTESFLDRFPHELSGGQQQRLTIAIAFAFDPAIVVMDEPTTGLDASTKLEIMRLVRRLSSEFDSSIVLISHDLRMLMAFTDRIVVMQSGRIVETLPSATISDDARDPYTLRLLGALPDPLAHRSLSRSATSAEGPLLAVRSLRASHGSAEITHGIGFEISAGSCLALVGESGSGKTTIARSVAGFHSEYSGSVLWRGQELPKKVTRRGASQLRAIQYVFQNPYASLNPRRDVRSILATAARLARGCSARAAAQEAAEMLDRVGVESRHLDSMPAALSGGQRQRVALARALMTRPELIICDEVTSSLDVSVQADIIDLLQGMQRDQGLAMLFITHDLALVSSVASQVVVLRSGEVVEHGAVEQVLEHPAQDYTRQLLVTAASSRDAADREGHCDSVAVPVGDAGGPHISVIDIDS